MKTGHQRIAIDLIEMNTGQIAGLPSNPRQWTKAQLDNLKASIEETPELLEARGCIVDYHEGKYVCLGGNMRYAACKALGMSELPCYVVPEGTSILKKKQIVAKDNVSMGDWDFDALANEWSDMDLEGWGVPIPPEWQDSIKEAEEKAKEDDFDEEKEEIPARCAKCDLWQLGEHTLMCGDSTSEEDVRKLMGGGGIKADLMLTDPPYNVNVSNSQGMTIQNDNMAKEDFRKFLSGAMNNAANALKPGGAFYIWYSHSEELNFREAVAKTGSLEVKQTLIWNKNGFTFGRQDYKWKHEPCLYGWKQGAGHWFRDEFNHPTVIEDNVDVDKLKKDELKEMLKNMLASPVPTDVIDADKPLRNDLHPTMKPLELCGQLIHNSSRPGQIVLDLFGGSGSTMMACEQLGRKNYTMEFDPHYCDVIIARWEKFTGMKAEKIE
jgi:site-specific DNA-methyltransferase (adenine-specific)|nr:MAG TPA: adenine specific DNA methyltransferase [Caudoviricetes sp.]